MASGELVGFITDIRPPATRPAAPFVLAGGNSTSAEQLPVWAFDPGSLDEYLDFTGRLRGYDGGGLTINLTYCTNAASGKISWSAAFQYLEDATNNLSTTNHTYSYQNVNPTVPGTAYLIDYTSITFTDGAQIDSLVDSGAFKMRLKRVASDTTNDTCTSDALLINVEIIET